MEIKPDIPIIMCSGHGDIVSEEAAKDKGIKKFVSKPLFREELFAAIREVLDEKST